jgi:hypothetical protein
VAPGLRKFALTAHIAFSVGWLGAAAGVLALAIAGVTSTSTETARGVYIAIDLMVWFVLVPLAVASLVTGVIQGLGSKWGLLRHYWVVAKLLLTVFATAILLLYTQTTAHFAELARQSIPPDAEIGGLSPVLHGAAGVLILMATTALAVYKPRGLTPWGQRHEGE